MTTMTTTQRSNPVHDLWIPMLVTGILTAILGVLVLVWPGVSILVAAVLFGAFLVVSGIMQVVSAFSLHVSAPYRVLLFLTGALSIILGVLAFRHFGEGYAVLLLAIWIGIGFIFQGVAETAIAVSHRDLPGRGWHIFFGIISVIAGLVVLAWPFDSIVVLAVVTGVWLIILGVTQVVAAFGTRRDVRAVEQRVSQVLRGTPDTAAGPSSRNP